MHKPIIDKLVEEFVNHRKPKGTIMIIGHPSHDIPMYNDLAMSTAILHHTMLHRPIIHPFISPIQNIDEWGAIKIDYKTPSVFDGKRETRFSVDEFPMWPQVYCPEKFLLKPVHNIIPFYKSWPKIIQYAINGTPYHQQKMQEANSAKTIFHKTRSLGPSLKK